MYFLFFFQFVNKILASYRSSGAVDNDQFQTQSDRSKFVNDVFKSFSKFDIDATPANLKILAQLIAEILPKEQEVNKNSKKKF